MYAYVFMLMATDIFLLDSRSHTFQMEGLVREMQDPETGVPVRSQKQFLTSIPSAFMGKLFRNFILIRLYCHMTMINL